MNHKEMMQEQIDQFQAMIRDESNLLAIAYLQDGDITVKVTSELIEVSLNNSKGFSASGNYGKALKSALDGRYSKIRRGV